MVGIFQVNENFIVAGMRTVSSFLLKPEARDIVGVVRLCRQNFCHGSNFLTKQGSSSDLMSVILVALVGMEGMAWVFLGGRGGGSASQQRFVLVPGRTQEMHSMDKFTHLFQSCLVRVKGVLKWAQTSPQCFAVCLLNRFLS